MALAKDNRQTEEQAAAFAKKAAEQHQFPRSRSIPDDHGTATAPRRQVLTWPPSGAGLSKLGYSAGPDACERSSPLGAAAMLTLRRGLGPAVLLGGVFVGAVAGVVSYEPGLADRALAGTSSNASTIQWSALCSRTTTSNSDRECSLGCPIKNRELSPGSSSGAADLPASQNRGARPQVSARGWCHRPNPRLRTIKYPPPNPFRLEANLMACRAILISVNADRHCE